MGSSKADRASTILIAGSGSVIGVAVLGGLIVVASSLAVPVTATTLAVAGVAAITVGGAAIGAVIGSTYARDSTPQRSTNQFQAFFEHVPAPAVGIRLEGDHGIVQHANTEFERVFGYDRDALIGQSLTERIVPPEKQDESAALIEGLHDGRVVTGEVQRETANGFRTFAFKGVPVAARGDVDAYAIYSDITTEQEQKQRLQVLYRVLRHDLRNRMNVVKGNAEIICEETTDPELREWAEALSASADELIELSSQTRQIERSLDAGDYERHTVDASRIVEDVLADLSRRYPDVEVRQDVPDELQVVANDLIDTAIGNAVENAFEHNTGLDQTVHVTVRSASRNYAEIRVRDDGPGIPESERRLFDGGSEITQLQHASGLGLWLLNWTVTQSGGEIELLDVEPTGTEVRIRLPLACRDEAQSGAIEEITGD